MALRPYWRGQIRLALVSIPVEIYSATRGGAAVAFHQIHQPSGKRVKYEKVVPGIGPIDTSEIVKGFELDKGRYVLVDDEELAGLKLESRKTLALTQFVDSTDIDPVYFDKPYYVVPADDLANEAFVVLREALRGSGKYGIGQLAMRGREYVVSIKPCGRGMVMETLRYADELREADAIFDRVEEIDPEPELLELAQSLIAKKSARFDAHEFRDRYADAVREMITARREGGYVAGSEREQPRQSDQVIDLMAALKRSLEDTAQPRRTHSGRSPR